MLFNIKKNEDLLPSLVFLNKTTKILKDSESILIDLLGEYQSLTLDSPIHSLAACSIVNSIITQKRYYFALTRTGLRNLIGYDQNIKHLKGFDNKQYSSILNSLYNTNKIMKLIKKGNTKTASIYQVDHPELVKYLESLSIDFEAQRIEALKFNSKAISKK